MHNPLTAILFCNYRFSTDQMSIQSPNQQFESTIHLVSTNGLTNRTVGMCAFKRLNDNESFKRLQN